MIDQLKEKLLALVVSRRFHAALIGILVLLFQDVLGLGPEQAQWISGIIVSWILGDSINKTIKYAVPPKAE